MTQGGHRTPVARNTFCWVSACAPERWGRPDGFCLSLDAGPARERLLDAIHGRGAFRMSKNGSRGPGIQDDWYRNRDDA